MFIGKGEQNQDENLKSLGKNCDGDLEFLEGDVKKSMVNDIPTIEFSERIQQIIFKEVGGLVGKVVKFDLNTDSKTRGCFAKMVVFVDLDKPLISQVMVNKEIQRVKNENLVLREDRISRGVAKDTNNNEGIVARLLGKKGKAGEASGLINGSVGHVLMEESSNFNVSNTSHKDSLVDPKIQAKKIKTTRLNLKDGDDLGLQSMGQVAKELAFEKFKKGGPRKES
ncbi:hypothetical protein Goari_018719 [Gossypium aridum]|uniref:Uncharacterized protein n=1 Tax=Gossypium aridum TaxID=34290 RepID=A0A7J8WQT8_GOSAI|nr:hypothetical protein [Gossypium aridum]